MSTPFYLRKFTADPDDVNIVFSADTYDTSFLHRSWDSQSQLTSRTLSEFDRAILDARPSLPASAAARPTFAEVFAAAPGTPVPAQRQPMALPIPRPQLTVDELWLLCRDVCVELDAKRRCMPAVMKVIVANARYMSVTKCGAVALSAVYIRAGLEDRQLIANALLPVFPALAMDAFGNYVVQRVLDRSDRTTAARLVVAHFSGRLLQMSCNKYASNVVQTAMRVCNGVEEVMHRCLRELVFNRRALHTLLHDKYGNFVLQTVLSLLPSLSELDHAARVLSPMLEESPYATNVYAKLNARRHYLMQPLLDRHRRGLRVCFPSAEAGPMRGFDELEAAAEDAERAEGVRARAFNVQGSNHTAPPANAAVSTVPPLQSMYDTAPAPALRAHPYRRPSHYTGFATTETAARYGASGTPEPASPRLATRPGSAIEISLAFPYSLSSHNAQG